MLGLSAQEWEELKAQQLEYNIRCSRIIQAMEDDLKLEENNEATI